MRISRSLLILAVLTLAAPLGAQMAMRAPDLRGIWHPVVGSGAAYDMTGRDGKKSSMELTIVGKEQVDGKDAYWMEFSVADPRSGGQVYAKNLMSVGDNGMVSLKMVFQPAGQPPMEMDLSGNAPGKAPRQQATGSDIRDKAELVGTESIIVPAGTFTCQHYRAKDGSSDAWISEGVAPWGLVKTQGKDTSMVLTKVITDAKDHITGTPTKFDPAQLFRNGLGNRGQ